MIVGRVLEIWRYPVKSMAGAELRECRVSERGIPGDRGWALRDEEVREIRGAKKFPSLLECSARYLREPNGGERSLSPTAPASGPTTRRRPSAFQISSARGSRCGRSIRPKTSSITVVACPTTRPRYARCSAGYLRSRCPI
jgi:hypothetical protein